VSADCAVEMTRKRMSKSKSAPGGTVAGQRPKRAACFQAAVCVNYFAPGRGTVPTVRWFNSTRAIRGSPSSAQSVAHSPVKRSQTEPLAVGVSGSDMRGKEEGFRSKE
jgi:hypothetical protein